MKTRHDPSTKPYYKCLFCPQFRHSCAGLPTRDMNLEEWCELILDVMDAFHLTIAYVSKEADVSEKTVERIRTISIEQDIMRSTARRIERVVLGPVGDHQCYLDCKDSEEIKRLQAEIEYWRKENDRKAKIIDRYLDA